MSNHLKLCARLMLAVASMFVFIPYAAGQVPRAEDSIAAPLCTVERLGTTIPVASIGEPVSAVLLDAPQWTVATPDVPSHCSIDGSILPIDQSTTASPILFRVLLPESWSRRSAQIGGGGTNGFIPNLAGEPLRRGFATYGSDSGHQAQRGRDAAPARSEWLFNDEAVRNFGYMQMKKTHDAAMVVIERMYGEQPEYNYYLGNSQGGREALTVAQRYPTDYEGIGATVPVVALSSLQLAPTLIRIQEKPVDNWIPPAKVNAIRGEFIRKCDELDGLADGVINNYMACRAIFDVTQGTPGRQPWAEKRCPNNVDPNPADTSADACLTDGQISTLHFVYGRDRFEEPKANGVESFGMWVPNTDVAGLMADRRLRGQEEAAADAPRYSHLSVPGVLGLRLRDLEANPLDYNRGSATVLEREQQLSEILDSTDPDLSRFHERGGKMLVTIGTNDTLASPGAQMDYYQAVIDRMGRPTVDSFARFFVMPQAGHGLSGVNYSVDGQGRTILSEPIPNSYDRLTVLTEWVENGIVPGQFLILAGGEKTLPLCSYPAYPRYTGGPAALASSYECTLN